MSNIYVKGAATLGDLYKKSCFAGQQLLTSPPPHPPAFPLLFQNEKEERRGGGEEERGQRSSVFLLFLFPLPFHSEKVEGIEKEGKTSAFKGRFGGKRKRINLI